MHKNLCILITLFADEIHRNKDVKVMISVTKAPFRFTFS